MDHAAEALPERTQAIARFVESLRYEQLPRRVVDAIKMSVLDTLGCGLFGSTMPWGRIVRDFARTQSGDAAVWGSGAITSSPHYAAMANGTMAHGFEIDDLHPASRSHPGAVMTPIALAARSCSGPISGAEAIVALAAGYEVQGRVGLAQGISSFNRGWHPTGTAGASGAAAAASKFRRLNADQTLHAIGIAGAMPVGLMAAQFGAMVKRLYVGHAAWAGMIAADLAAAGFTGVENIFDAEYGGYFAAVSDDFDVEHLASDLGERYEAANIGVKFWPCVGTNQSVLDVLSELRAATKFSAEDVERLDIRTTAYQKLHSGWTYKPSSVMTAQMNMQYCLATFILEGRLSVEEFTEDKIAAPRTMDLIERITVTADETLDRTPGYERFCEATLHLRDGRTLTGSRTAAHGSPKDPASWSEIASKFLGLATRVLPQARAESIVDLVSRLETLADIDVIDKAIRISI